MSLIVQEYFCFNLSVLPAGADLFDSASTASHHTFSRLLEYSLCAV